MADETQNIIVRVLSESELDALTKELDTTQKALAKMAAEGDTASVEYKALTDQAKKLSAELRGQKAATDAVTKSQQQNNEATDQAEKKQTSLRGRLKEVRSEMALLAEAGDTSSDAFLRLQAEAGELQDTIGDVGQRIRAMSSDTKAIDSVVGGIGLLANSFAAAQAATSLFTKDNEKLAAQFMKVQQALALATSVQQIANAVNKDSILMTNLHAAAVRVYNWAVVGATGATRTFRVALASTGVGAAVVALGFLATKLLEVDAAAEDVSKSVKDTGDAYVSLADDVEFAERKAKAFGATEEELAKQRKAQAEQEIIYNQAMYDELAAMGATAKNSDIQMHADEIKRLEVFVREQQNIIDAAAKDRADKAKAEAERTAKENQARRDAETGMMLESMRNVELMQMEGLAKELKIIDNAFADKIKRAGNNEALITQLTIEHRATRQEKIDEWNKKELEANEAKCDAEIEQERAKEEAIQNLLLRAYESRKDAERSLRDALTSGIAGERARRRKQYDDELEDLKNAKLNELYATIESEEYKQAEAERQAQILGEIQSKYRAKEKMEEAQFSAEMVDIKMKEKEDKLRIQEFYVQALNDSLTGIAQMIEGFGKSDEEAQKKNFERTKKFSIAVALIDTYLAAQRAYLSQMQLDPSAPVRATIAAAAAVISGLGRVAMIKKQTFQGGGGSGGGGGSASGGFGGGGSMPTNAAMSPNTTRLDANGRPLNQSGSGGNTPPPLRAFVVENDIRTTTRRLNTISENARL